LTYHDRGIHILSASENGSDASYARKLTIALML
jgi:hypothetical protein